MFEALRGGPVGGLQSALDALATEDLFALPPGAVLDRTALLVQARNRIDAELTRTVRHADTTQACEHDGIKTMASWLRGHHRVSPAAAHRLVACGRALEQLPALAAAFAAGRVTAEQVAVAAPVAAPAAIAAAAAQGVDTAVIDAALTAVATTQPHAQLGRVVHHYLACLDPDGPEPDPTEGRSFTMARHADGSGTGRFDLDAVGFEKVQAAIESIVQAARPKGDDRSRAQQNADALVQLADNALASGSLPTLRTVKPHVIVLIDAQDLTDTATGPGTARTGFG